jgi:hypothetical protein
VSTIEGEEQRMWSAWRKERLFISVGGACRWRSYKGSKDLKLRNFMEAFLVKHSRSTVKKKQGRKMPNASMNTWKA